MISAKHRMANTQVSFTSKLKLSCVGFFLNSCVKAQKNTTSSKYFRSISIISTYEAGEFKEHELLWCTKPWWFHVCSRTCECQDWNYWVNPPISQTHTLVKHPLHLGGNSLSVYEALLTSALQSAQIHHTILFHVHIATNWAKSMTQTLGYNSLEKHSYFKDCENRYCSVSPCCHFYSSELTSALEIAEFYLYSEKFH